MKIKSIRTYSRNLALLRPYAIAYKTVTDVENVFAEVELENGVIGLGAGCPMTEEMKEGMEDSLRVLHSSEVNALEGKPIETMPALIGALRELFPGQPAALAAIDIALHDAFAQFLNIPLVNFWGQRIGSLPTSITVGIKNVTETLTEAQEYLDRGFSVLKIKLGAGVEEDVERLVKLREKYGSRITIRIDVNQGYEPPQIIDFFEKTKALNIELIEQPISAKKVDEMKALPDALKKEIAADEALTTPASALRLLDGHKACGIFNIKLMKSGGLQAAGEIANIAKHAGVDLMWGCNDESLISITAALHLAFANAHTKFIDLDGSLDLGEDVATGGFILKNGVMRIDESTLGLGVQKIVGS